MEYLGKRESELYGTISAKELDESLMNAAKVLNQILEIRYTNIEGEAKSLI